MSYSLEPKYRRYVQGYGFFSFARKFGDKYGKKLMNTATKTGINAAKQFEDKYGKNLMDSAAKAGIDAAKTASKRVVQKTEEATVYLIGNKTADKITSLGKSKNKEKQNETNEVEEIYIPTEKRQQIIDDLRFRHGIKMEYQKITNLLGNTSDKVPRFITKNG